MEAHEPRREDLQDRTQNVNEKENRKKVLTENQNPIDYDKPVMTLSFSFFSAAFSNLRHIFSPSSLSTISLEVKKPFFLFMSLF